MNIERFKKAIEIVEKIPERNFDMTVFANTRENWESDRYGKLKPRCGTVGCALGWIASDDWMREQGYHLSLGEKGSNSDGFFIWRFSPEYKGCSGFASAGEFFNISMEEVSYLFADGGYGPRELLDPNDCDGREGVEKPISKEEVLVRMRCVLAKYESTKWNS
ncbi:MAG TPA: hypothetical protein VJQ25_11180 [Nitrospira sp.]|nr:hypothetical protein [Nitrospira sp.]